MKNKFLKTTVFIILLLLVGIGLDRWYISKSKEAIDLKPDTEIIQEQLKNVSKLVVNEAKLSQVFTYKDQQSYFMNLISFDKKAVVVVNADVQVMYDLSKLDYQIDEVNKVVRIISIPKEEIKINPDIKIYDVEQSRFNTFKGEDYNKINEKVKAEFYTKVLKSNITTNAKNRLISELSKFLVVTNSLGWTLQYQDMDIKQQTDFEQPLQL
ncbi:DUF4230 domain-containing protein [Myroides ceti]|uniref:DUF4230 domain-containing protein n=1 Tax=Paenimyroides ceti TaxID=395087 RepID=A0ABT8CUX2_9FLAO|nr:DUF4230 domain-containing protein [Paenimyroides ceti]MDN3708283.1 DUF4230 domain-containing protein [Paenimyroides ceti]MDN3709293.1 DUF4230 domain-containing protein [Paenimyroides ceti]